METYDPNRPQSDPAMAEQYDGPFSPRGTRILKIAVIVMGIMLIVGFMIVVVTIAYRAMKLGEDKPSANPAVNRHGFSRLDVEVEPDTLISQIELDGNRMAVHVSKGAADEILIIDIRRGELLGRVRLREKAPADP